MTQSFSSYEAGHWRQTFIEYRYLPPILLLSLVLNLWGNRWGTPNLWHPDEIITRSIGMVERRTVNPHHFAYGGLQYYVQAVVAITPALVYARIFDSEPSTLDPQAHNQWRERQRGRMIQMARAVSALMSALVVCITFVIGTILFDKGVGYLAALLLAVSKSFVAIAHFATVDSAANFWYWLSCLFALLLWKRGKLHWYVLAAFTAGFAIGTKVDRLVILFPLLVSHFLRREGLQLRKLFLFAILIPASFVLANPTLITAPFEFLDGVTRDLYFNSLRGQPRQTFYISMLGYMIPGLGLPLFATAIAGLAYGLYDLGRPKNPARIVWLLATFLPYVVIPGFTLVRPWYVPFLFPPLMVLSAYGCVHVVACLPQRYTFVAKYAIAAIAVYSFLYTIALIMQFTYDSRYQAAQWIEQHIPANATILMFKSARGPVISSTRYQLIHSLPDRDIRSGVIRTGESLLRHRAYRRLRQAILDLEQWMGRWISLPARDQPYRAWFDNDAASYEDPSNRATGLSAVEVQKPDYVIIFDERQRKTLSALKSSNSGYRLVAEFRFINRSGMQPSFSFVNPRVSIFKREWRQSFHQPRLGSQVSVGQAYLPAVDTNQVMECT